MLSSTGYSLAVCSGHLNSEVERASYGGDSFTVTDIVQDNAV